VTRVALLVTHLMGSGHLVRILAIAHALKAAGAVPVVLSGGRPLPWLDSGGVEIIQLPPLTARVGDYRTLRLPDGTPADKFYLDRRREMLTATLRGIEPAVLVTESWPFGRRALAAEFHAALDAADAPAICSLRDVPEPPSKPARVAEALDHAARFAAILVHGDPSILPLSASWPVEAALGVRLRYTGYVGVSLPLPIPCEDTVLVTVGGGSIGRRLLHMAAHAARHSPWRWHLLVGGADAAGEANRLRALGPVAAEPASKDYRARLQGAAVSVSLAGYNTAVDVAMAGIPALLVPMNEGGEREQAIRAPAFARAFPTIETATLAVLTPQTLAATADRLAATPRARRPIDLDGAARAAAAVLAVVEGRHNPPADGPAGTI
jgi:predicted glycosyltransferase